ncbi:MAG TPA: vWA domain-containing protein [Planctomycetaceae bacterium]|nr:vWA domain-containing protein [Planctomycetaceae bacterium]
MSSWKKFCEWYLGLPPAQSGEGTRWEWGWQTPWPQGWPVALVGVLTITFLIGLWWAYRRDAALLKPWQVVCLAGLRIAAVIGAMALWAQPTLWVAKTGLPAVAVLIDSSASMSFRDSRGASADSASPGPRRLDQVTDLLLADDAAWLRTLSQGRPLRIYHFAGQATPIELGELTTERDWKQLADTIRKLEPDGPETRPAEAVRQVLAELRGMPPAAMVVFSDGVASESDADKLSTVSDLIRRRGVPWFVVPVGSDLAGRDVHLFDVVMDDVAFKGDPVSVTGKIRANGVTDSKLVVTIKRVDTGATLTTVEVTPRADGQPVRFETTVKIDEAGEIDLDLETPVVTGEVDKSNNRERRHLSVREERLRVLLVESGPRYEFRYLKQWLERDNSVELQTILLDADPEYAQEDRTALPYFPVQREALWKYDVIVLGDVSLIQLGATAPGWIVDFVREKGGGVIVVSGPRAAPRGWAGSALEALLPIPSDALAAIPAPAESTEAFTPQLTLDGQKGVPIFRFAESEAASVQVLKGLPGFYGLVDLPRMKTGVRVLAEHPFRRGERERLPVITLQQVGAGKVLFHASDELWRWRFRQGDTYYGKYWSQAIRYLSRGKLLGQDRAVEFLTDRQIFRRNEPVTLRARFVEERQAPTDEAAVRVVVEQTSGGRQEVTLKPLAFAPNVFEGQITPSGEGAYHAWISRPSFTGPPPAVDFRVESTQRELQQRTTDRADLKVAAQRAGGRFIPLAEAKHIPEWVPPGIAVPLEYGVAVPLWQRSETLVLLALLLGAEWFLRRRWRLV